MTLDIIAKEKFLVHPINLGSWKTYLLVYYGAPSHRCWIVCWDSSRVTYCDPLFWDFKGFIQDLARLLWKALIIYSSYWTQRHSVIGQGFWLSLFWYWCPILWMLSDVLRFVKIHTLCPFVLCVFLPDLFWCPILLVLSSGLMFIWDQPLCSMIVGVYGSSTNMVWQYS